MKYLEIAISLIFIFLLLSLFTSVIMEFIATFARMRASTLKQTIAKMLSCNSTSDDSIKKFYELPLIKMLGEQKWVLGNLSNDAIPHQIDTNTFVKAVKQLINDDGQITSETINKSSLNESAKDYLKLILEECNNDITSFEKGIAKWYDGMIERTIGWYKRKVQYWLIWIGIAIATLFNADSIRLVNDLSKDDKARIALVNSAIEFLNKNKSIDKLTLDSLVIAKDTTQIKLLSTKLLLDSKDPQIDSLNKTILKQYAGIINESNNLLGWEGKQFQFISLLGFILTGFAISLGATFWFDMLKKFIDIKTLGLNK